MPSVYDSPSASEDSDPLQVLSSEECTASSKASTSLKITVGDPMKAKTSVLLSCKSLSSLSTSDYKLTTPSALSHEAMLPLNRLIKFDGIVRHGFLLSSILVFKTSQWRERFVFYTSFCVDGYLDRHMAVIPAKGLMSILIS